MNNQVLETIIHRLSNDVSGRPGYWKFYIDDLVVSVITDEKADRMRIIVPVTTASALSSKQLYRVMQANFDTALDARYAIAQDVLWAAFIHPLSVLTAEEFVSGVAQTSNLVKSFGTSYASGALSFGGGDSSRALRQRHERLIQKGLSI